MSKATGKARHPHDASRPLPARIQKALAENDIEAVKAGLSVRQRRFAEEYVVDFNGLAAALRAGYSTSYPDRQAHILLKHEGVRAYIDDLTQSKEVKIMAIDPDYLIAQVVSVVTKDGVRDGDKLRALELLMKHKGMFIDRTEITGKDGGPIEQRQLIEEEAENFTNMVKKMRRSDGKADLKAVK